MNNIMLLIKINDNKSETLDNFNKEIINYFSEKNYDYTTKKNYILFINKEKKIIVEYQSLNNSNKFIYNITYNITINKRNFIREIYFSSNISECILVYDTSSNKILKDNYKELSKLENLLKYFLVSRIAAIQGDRVFDIIDQFIVKEYIGEKYNKMSTTLQRINLSEIVDFINSNPLGGDEINILKSLSQVNEDGESKFSEDHINKVRNKIQENVFKDIKNLIDNFGKMDSTYEWRNSIAHNGCVEEEIFERMAQDVKKLTEEIEKMCIDVEKTNISSLLELEEIPQLGVLLRTDLEKYNVLLRIIECYNKFFDNKLFKELVEGKIKENDNMIIFIGKDLKIIIIDIIPEMEFDNNYDYNTYKILFFFNNIEEKLFINKSLYSLLDNISIKYIVIYDVISDFLCNELYQYVNYLENMVRLYVKISEIVLSSEPHKKINKKNVDKRNLRLIMDLNALRINIDEKKINLVNNDLYEMNFIKLFDKLSSPLIDKSYSKLMENKDYTDIDKFNRSIADLSSIDSRIESIGKKWSELYKIRTMVAHNFIMSNDAFLEYISLYKEASSEIEEAMYNLIANNIVGYNLNYNVNKNNKSLSIEYLINSYQIKLTTNDTIDLCSSIPNNFIWKVINKIFDMNLSDEAIFLTTDIIEELSNVDIESFTNNILDLKIKDIIWYHKSSYYNGLNDTYIKLEKSISDLLQLIAKEYEL